MDISERIEQAAKLQNLYSAMVQCTAMVDGAEVTGTFIARVLDPHKPISPVFDGLYDLIPWMHKNGWLFDEYATGEFIPLRVSPSG